MSAPPTLAFGRHHVVEVEAERDGRHAHAVTQRALELPARHVLAAQHPRVSTIPTVTNSASVSCSTRCASSSVVTSTMAWEHTGQAPAGPVDEDSSHDLDRRGPRGLLFPGHGERSGHPVVGVEKTFGEAVALRSLDLDVPEGRFVVLLGPSGCGKTTALRILAGLETPTAGTVAIGSATSPALPPRARDVAMVFQSYALYPHMSVGENVGYPLQIRGLSRTRGRAGVEEVAQSLEIDICSERTPAAALGRAAPAGRAGARDRPRAGGVPDGRAALESRRQAPDVRSAARSSGSRSSSASPRSTSRTTSPRRRRWPTSWR